MLVPLRRESLEQMIPAIATGAQYRYTWGRLADVLRRLLISIIAVIVILIIGAALGPSFAFLQFSLGVGAGFYWFWGPVAVASRRNRAYRKYPYAGLLEARVLDLYVTEEVVGTREDVTRQGDLVVKQERQSYLNLELGESVGRSRGDRDRGFEARIRVPLRKEHQAIRRGQRMQLVVLSKAPDLSRIEKLTDAYVPAVKVWVSDYPYLRRDLFTEATQRLLESAQRLEQSQRRRSAYDAQGYWRFQDGPGGYEADDDYLDDGYIDGGRYDDGRYEDNRYDSESRRYNHERYDHERYDHERYDDERFDDERFDEERSYRRRFSPRRSGN